MRNPRRRLLLTFPLTLLTLFGAASLLATAPANASPKHRVVATVGMVADIVRNVAGDRADVIGMMGSGVDPHLYKPT
ncbi:MAG: zinc ABC transporter substrate-binding protein, partial [Planctomycetota bacterium]|nr:zinc ABC transporter substrate-binding protein [Planctomycetota bacterium]